MTMAFKVKKSKNATANVNGERMDQQIKKNLYVVGNLMRTNANSIAPLDSGVLRNSASVQRMQNKVAVIWTTPYAEKVYKKNKKNPQTTEWAEKDKEKNQQTYLEELNKGVVKK